MNEIYPMWVAAHGIMIVWPVNWYQAPSGSKLMIDRLVCADGGNPDPTSTHGKDAEAQRRSSSRAGTIRGISRGRLFAIVVHGDASGTENLRRILTDWLRDMGSDPGRPPGADRPLYRLLRALCDEP